MTDTNYAMTKLRQGGYFVHKNGHVIGKNDDGSDIIADGFRTYLYDENNEICFGLGLAERWTLWDKGVLSKDEKLASKDREYIATYRLKE